MAKEKSETKVASVFENEKTGAKSPVLRFKKGEEEEHGLDRLENKGWNVKSVSYHLGPDGLSLHAREEADCKYCKKQSKGGVSPPVDAKPMEVKVEKIEDAKQAESVEVDEKSSDSEVPEVTKQNKKKVKKRKRGRPPKVKSEDD